MTDTHDDNADDDLLWLAVHGIPPSPGQPRQPVTLETLRRTAAARRALDACCGPQIHQLVLGGETVKDIAAALGEKPVDVLARWSDYDREKIDEPAVGTSKASLIAEREQVAAELRAQVPPDSPILSGVVDMGLQTMDSSWPTDSTQ